MRRRGSGGEATLVPAGDGSHRARAREEGIGLLPIQIQSEGVGESEWGGVAATWRRRWGDGIGGLPRSRSGKGEREEWERMGATWGWGLGFQGDKVEWEGPAGPVGWSGGPSACWAEA